MIHSEYCEALRTEAEEFVALVSRADPATPIPTCPGWDLATLVGHVGSTHRWVTAMVDARATDKLPYPPFHAEIPGEAAALPEWLAEGAAKLVACLASTPPDLPMWAWGPDHHARFWSRRMLHEVAVHHADAALALGQPVTVDAAVAGDGIDEFLTNLPHARWVPGAAAVDGAGRTLALVATDTGTAWRIALGEADLSWSRTDAPGDADVVVSGPVAELYLFVYGRIPPPDAAGDTGLLARWTAATAL